MNPLDQLIQLNLSGGAIPQVQPPLAPAVPAAPVQPQPAVPVPTVETNPWNDSRFLLDLGAKLLQPRQESEGQFGFAANALTSALNVMDARRAAGKASKREDKKLDLQQQGVDVEKQKAATQGKLADNTLDSQSYINRLREAQTEKEKALAGKARAEAANEKATGGKGMPAASVQETNQVATALKTLFPQAYKGSGADAQSVLDAKKYLERVKTNPQAEFADLFGEYLKSNAFIASPDEQANVRSQMAVLVEAMKNAGSAEGIATETAKANEAREKANQKVAEESDPQNKVIPADRLFGGMTLEGARRQLEVFKANPAAISNYVLGRTQDVSQQRLWMQQIYEMMQRIPSRP